MTDVKGRTIQQLVDEYGWGIKVRLNHWESDSIFIVENESNTTKGVYEGKNKYNQPSVWNGNDEWFLVDPPQPEWQTLDALLKGKTFPVKVTNQDFASGSSWFEVIGPKRISGYPGYDDDGEAGGYGDDREVWKLWSPPPEPVKKDRWVAFFIDDASDYNHHKISIIRESGIGELQKNGVKLVRCPWLDPGPDWSPSSG